MTPTAILTDALALLDGGRAWCRGARENKYCMVMALRCALSPPDSNTIKAACVVLKQVIGLPPDGAGLALWNDAATWPEVEAALLKAIEVSRG